MKQHIQFIVPVADYFEPDQMVNEEGWKVTNYKNMDAVQIATPDESACIQIRHKDMLKLAYLIIESFHAVVMKEKNAHIEIKTTIFSQDDLGAIK